MSFKVAAFQIAVIAAGLFFGGIAESASARTIQLVGLGDSLMAGYQLPPGDGFPAKLEAALKAKGLDVVVADAGVSGHLHAGRQGACGRSGEAGCLRRAACRMAA